MPNLTGKVAVVTGSTKGIGLAIAERMVNEGASVVVTARTATEVEEVAARLGDAALGVPCDVAVEADCRRLVDRAVERFGRLDVLVNNAGFGVFKSISEMSVEEWRRQIDVNLAGVFYCSKAALPPLSATGDGFIINIGSLAGRNFFAGGTGYNAAKAAVRSLTESLAHELRNLDGCRVQAHLLVPGWTTTGDREHRPGAWLPEQVADFLLAAIDRGEFYVICPDDETTWEMDRKRILWGAMDLTSLRPALSRWHPDWKAAFDAFEPPPEG